MPTFEPTVIERPSAANRGVKVLKSPHLRAYFDGGCCGGLGSGGFVVYGQDNEQLGGGSMYYGKLSNTNNEVEMSALLDLLTWVDTHSDELPATKTLHVIGDSELMINFMNRAARPSKPSLMRKVVEATTIRHRLGMRVIFSHVLRAGNQVADWLARQAAIAKATRSMDKLGVATTPGGSAPVPLEEEADFQGVNRTCL